MNLMTFDVVLKPPVGMASFTHSVTIFSGRKTRRKEKIKRIFDERKRLLCQRKIDESKY